MVIWIHVQNYLVDASFVQVKNLTMYFDAFLMLAPISLMISVAFDISLVHHYDFANEICSDFFFCDEVNLQDCDLIFDHHEYCEISQYQQLFRSYYHQMS